MSLLKKITAITAASLLFSTFATAQQPSPEERAVDVRQSVFKLISSNMGPVGAMVRGRADFDADVATKHITRVNQLSLMINDTFAVDTRESGIETEALDAIWENMSDFEAKSQALTDATQAALTALASGDEDAAKSAMGGIGRNCGGCHDDYRVEN